MPQIINTNISSLNAQRNLDKSQSAQDTALQRLSSGLRINSAKDDAAGIAIANRLDAQVKGLSVASRNAGDGVSLAQIAEGSIESISTSLQRLRELAVQSSNSTNGDSERTALNNEAQQLIEEIERTSSSASFNGVNLLDGSFQGKTFQVGANVGDEVAVSLGSVGTDSLGAAQTSGVSTISSNITARTASLTQGDLVLNGVAVGAADAAADGSSTASTAFSGIAMASAINKVSDQSGVTAVANANSVTGTIVATVAAAAAAITINGVAITMSGSGVAGNLDADLQGIADQVNLFSGQTGVTASLDQKNLEAGVTLTAADGRNIVVAGATAAAYGIGAANTYTGSVTLISDDGGDVVVSSTTGNSLENAGIEVGTYSGKQAIANSDKLTATALVAGDLVINDVSVGRTLDTYDSASTASKSGSAIAKAAAINLVSDATGVTANANATQVTSTAITAATATVLTVNGLAITSAVGSAAGGTAEQVGLTVDAINSKTGQTGVRAEAIDADQYQLIADDGRNIVTSAPTNAGIAAGTNVGSISLSSGGPIEISTKNTANLANSGFETGSFGGAESGVLLKDVDISTADGAKAAIKAVDNALNSVNSERAKLGSIQSRFENVISANAIAIENFSASASRIKDADFAAETAALSRAQVLQQAGISVLAQANARPQQVLSLLQ
jgi:flagellin